MIVTSAYLRDKLALMKSEKNNVVEFVGCSGLTVKVRLQACTKADSTIFCMGDVTNLIPGKRLVIIEGKLIDNSIIFERPYGYKPLSIEENCILHSNMATLLPSFFPKVTEPWSYHFSDPTYATQGIRIVQEEAKPSDAVRHIGAQSCEFFAWSEWARERIAQGIRLHKFCSRCRCNKECRVQAEINSKIKAVVVNSHKLA